MKLPSLSCTGARDAPWRRRRADRCTARRRTPWRGTGWTGQGGGAGSGRRGAQTGQPLIGQNAQECRTARTRGAERAWLRCFMPSRQPESEKSSLLDANLVACAPQRAQGAMLRKDTLVEWAASARPPAFKSAMGARTRSRKRRLGPWKSRRRRAARRYPTRTPSTSCGTAPQTSSAG
jgi:hypothetical protein